MPSLAAQLAALPEAERLSVLAALPMSRMAQVLGELPPDIARAVILGLPDNAVSALRHATLQLSFSAFVRAAWPLVRLGDPLRWGWHIDAICEHLEAVHRGEIRKLLITVCPGSAKSLLVEVFWPAWMWASDPTRQLMCLASDSDLATRDSVRCRDLIRSGWYQGAFSKPDGWTLSGDQNVKSYFTNTRTGFRYSAGVSASVTGWRGHGVIMDDLLQAKDALSKPARDAVVYALENVIPSRVNDLRTGFFVMIQQRLCMGDPADWAIGTKEYEHLNLPTEYIPGRAFVTHRTVNGKREEFRRDPRTTEGELLFPDMFPPEVVAAAKKHPEMYAAQHQQDPMPVGGGMFKTAEWRFWRHPDAGSVVARDPGWYQGPSRPLPKKFDKVVLSCDATFRKTTTGSRVAIHAWGALGGDRFLLDREWGRMDFNETERALLRMITKWPTAREKIIEGKANGDGLIARLRDVHKIAGITEGKPNEGDKIERANEMLPYVAGGNVYLPEHAPWLADYITEHAVFPAPCHLGNDDVDAQSQALKNLEGRPVPTFSFAPGGLSMNRNREDD